jgi:predicted nucleotide-binding protein (sugar kinase/HSP70/actin superfamily)
VALEISSFKCGHDAPIYGVIEGIIEQSGTPYFCFKDLDENKPTGSIRIRVETIDYFLRRYREEVIRKRKAADDIEAQLAALEAELRGQVTSEASLAGAQQFEPEAQGMAAD